ncbi:hypothetical protein HGRIS_003896 [Hohenbuehelia grisea]|uniref:Uncharacterized protein n=1 Tax=Hohenbuehelia grisea TaxID=104357 RepID=A0ABR3JHB3_9AGAR
MNAMGRRKSFDSSDSDSDSSSNSAKGYHKDKKDKKDKVKKDKKDKDGKDKKDKEKKDKSKDHKDGSHAQGSHNVNTAAIDHNQARFHTSQAMEHDPNQYAYGHGQGQAPLMPSFEHAGQQQQYRDGGAPQHQEQQHPQSPPPNYAPPPPSGYRVPLTTSAPFPEAHQIGQPAAHDADGSPIYIGSALFENSVHPCKIGPHLQPYVAVPYGGAEYAHHGRYDLLPFDPQTMEWVPAYGQLPQGRKLVEGGYEENGTKLYHALADVQGLKVPGKTGEHLNGCNVSFGGAEVSVNQNYSVLCWRH